MEERIRFLEYELSEVIGDVEIEGVFAIAGDLNVLRPAPHLLQRCGNLKRKQPARGIDIPQPDNAPKR